MHVSARLTRPSVAHRDRDGGHLVVSVTGDDTVELRPRLGIVAVIDRSGSMGTARKLDIVAAALDHLAGELCDDDQLSLITFDGVVERHLAPTAADDAGVAAFRSALAAVHPRGATALADALAAGVATAAQMPDDRLVRVLVCTDGQATVGVQDPEAIAAIAADLPANVTVSTIGVGADCDHDLLARLAEQGSGSYGFVETPADASAVIGADLGGLLSAVATEVTVQVTPRQWGTLTPVGVSAVEIPADETTPRKRRPSGPGWKVNLGAVLAGSTRHVVFELATSGPRAPHARPVTVADVVVSAVVDDEPVTRTVMPKVHFVAADRVEVPDDDDGLTEVVDRARLGQARRDADAAAAAGRFDAARLLLEGVAFETTSVGSLRDAIAVNYADAGSYLQSSAMRASAASVLSTTASLSGSSSAFDALASRTIGSYQTSAQREGAARTRRAVADRLAGNITVPDAPVTGSGTLGAPLEFTDVHAVGGRDEVLWRSLSSPATLTPSDAVSFSTSNSTAQLFDPPGNDGTGEDDDDDNDDDGLAGVGAVTR